MPALTASERAQRRADLAPMITSDAIYVQITRPPAVAAAKRGNATLIASDVPMQIWPANGQSDPKELQTIVLVAGARMDAYAYAQHGTDIQIGDEIATPAAQLYKVVGLARWNASIALALGEVTRR